MYIIISNVNGNHFNRVIYQDERRAGRYIDVDEI